MPVYLTLSGPRLGPIRHVSISLKLIVIAEGVAPSGRARLVGWILDARRRRRDCWPPHLHRPAVRTHPGLKKLDHPIKKLRENPNILRVALPIEVSAGANCPDCSWQLALSQPDVDSPERLLGICEQCKHWFLIELPPDQPEPRPGRRRRPRDRPLRLVQHERRDRSVPWPGRSEEMVGE
jgi:hypothetical protein